jgi:diguanylate cyclase (GGDEF)-like protein
MLDLRSVADQRYGNPVALIDAFLAALAPKLAADSAALFLFSRDGASAGPAVARIGGPDLRGVAARWKQYEETLARLAIAVDRPRVINATELPRYGVDALLGTVLLLPLRRDDQQIGVIVLSWSRALLLTGMEQNLATWAAEFLAQAIPRVLSQAVFERQARQDGLTGLANRREWDRQFALALDEARRFGSPLSVLLCDLDRFKSINDLYGHRAGDEVLRVVARTFQDQVIRTRASDAALVARYGGEEIAVLLPGFEAVGALRVAEAIRNAVQETVIAAEGRQLRATMSIGLAAFPTHSDSPEGLIAGADLALYEAKTNGRNRVCTAGPLAMTEPLPTVTPRRTVRTDPHLLK